MNQQPKKIQTDEQKGRELVDISLAFGDETNSKELVKLKFKFEMGKEDHTIREEINKIEDNGQEDDQFIRIAFNVPPGREKEAIDYLQKGMNEPDKEKRKSFNYIQRWIKRPKTHGVVHFKHNDKKDGKVYLYFAQYKEQMDDLHRDFMEAVQFWTFSPRIELNFSVKGQETKDYQERTALEPNYSKFDLKVMASPEEIITIVQRVHSKFGKNIVFKLLSRGIKKISIKSKLNIFQKLTKMYSQIADDEDEQDHGKDRKIGNNLLCKSFQMAISWKKFGLWNIDVEFEKEEYLHIILGKVMPIFEEND